MGSSTLIMPRTPRASAAPPTGGAAADVAAHDAANEALVRRHVRGVWRFLRLLGCSPDEADDLTQEVFLVALRKGTGDRDAREVAAFLRNTARHLFLRSRRLRGRRAEQQARLAEQLFGQACGEDGGDRRVEALRGCVEQLAERSRALVRMFYGEERSRAEVAAVLGIKETGVKTALQRVRQSLRECLQKALQRSER